MKIRALKTRSIGWLCLLVGVLVISHALIVMLKLNPNEYDLAREFAFPEPGAIFGYGENGVNLAKQLLWAIRTALGVGLCVVAVSCVVGVSVGLVAGFFGGTVDFVCQRAIEIVLSLPGLLISMAFAALLGPGFLNLVVAQCVLAWAGYARATRAQVKVLRSGDVVAASKASGASTVRTVVWHVLPFVMPTVVVQMGFGLANAIVVEGSLSFLGLGLGSQSPSLGSMIFQGREAISTNPHVVLVPGVSLLALLWVAYRVADSVQDDFVPKIAA